MLSTEFIDAVSSGDGSSEFVQLISGYYRHFSATHFVFVLIENSALGEGYHRQLTLVNRLLPDIGKTCLIFGSPASGNDLTDRLRHHLENHHKRHRRQQLCQQQHLQQRQATRSCDLFCRLRHLWVRLLLRRCSTCRDVTPRSTTKNLSGNRRQLQRLRCDGPDDDCYGNLNANQVVLDANEKLMSGASCTATGAATERY